MTNTSSSDDIRPGDSTLDFDPGRERPDAGLVFIGRVAVASPAGGPTPHNPTEARQRGAAASVVLDAPYRPGLAGLTRHSHVFVLVWLDHSHRDIIAHQPRHLTEPRGVFALRSPLRPNPIGLSVARITSVDVAAGRVEVDALDFRDGTPVIDLKPYRPGIDAIPDALIG